MHTRRRRATITATVLFAHPLYPPAPADTHGGAALARDAVLWVHAHNTKRQKTKRLSSNKVIEGGGVQVGALEMPGIYQPSTLSRETKVSKPIQYT